MKTYKYILYLSLFLIIDPAFSLDYREHPPLVRLVEQMAQEDGYPRDELEAAINNASIDQSVINAMNRQYEALPWYKYRKLFINQDRIDRGIAWWKTHGQTLQRAADTYGVPAEVIVALIGVETHFGTRMGDKRVLDSLVTLTADYPRRSQFFGSELRIFLNATRKENIAPESVVGSFAGAIGIPQFMPSSYQAYAVDFNGNGRRDLVSEVEDAIGSVANYLKVHGWTRDQVIFATAPKSLSARALELVSKKAKPKLTADELNGAGIDFNPRGGSERMALLRLKEEPGNTYIIGFRNFYAITRYNPSVNYAMAVTELSQRIKAGYVQ